MVGPDPFRGGVVETLSGAGLPSRQWSVSSQRATGVMEALSDRADELVDDLVKAIMGAHKRYVEITGRPALSSTPITYIHLGPLCRRAG